MQTVLCPSCQTEVVPQPVGTTSDDGEWEYEYTECPMCEYVFLARELT